jgi:isoquinoline 1-oxidoreductase
MVNQETIFDHLLKVAPESNRREERGNLAEGERIAGDVSETKYLDGYVAHAPIETHTAVARIEGGKATVWTSTQAPFTDQRQVARAIGMESDNVRIITPFVGGGFGGKVGGRQAGEAARLAKITGKPVQVMWNRAEEFFYDSFRPAAVVKVKSGIDSSGRLCLWDYNVYFAGARGSEQLYDVPHNIINVHGEWGRAEPGSHPFAVGAWRAPGANTNIFAKESQIDIMAVKAGMDPMEFRLRNTSDKRLLSVLRLAAEKFGWKKGVGPSGRGYGISCGIDAGTYVAEIAEVEVDKRSGQVQVKRVVCAQDMGIVINPEGAKMQMEGCITMGLGYALTEDIRFEGGHILDSNFDTYELPRFSQLPEIECHLVKNDGLSPQGGGEPAIIGMGGAVANAIFDATGARVLQLPMTPDRVKEALSKI